MPARKFPRPDRSNVLPQRNARVVYNRVIDTGRGDTTLPDGRACLVEDWHDGKTGLDLRTYIYSRIGIEEWSEAQHLEALAATGRFNGHSEGTAILSSLDASGREVWSVIVVAPPAVN